MSWPNLFGPCDPRRMAEVAVEMTAMQAAVKSGISLPTIYKHCRLLGIDPANISAIDLRKIPRNRRGHPRGNK